MGFVASTVAGLGTPVDGAEGLVRTGGHLIRLTYSSTAGAWSSRPLFSVRQVATLGMRDDGTINAWKYPVSAETLADPTAVPFGFQLHHVERPDLLVAAGLRMQEHLSAEIQMQDLAHSGSPQFAVNWYDLADGGAFLSPTPTNIGVPLVAERHTDVARFYSTGWQDSPALPPASGNSWYPELYQYGPTVVFRHLACRYRWVSGPAASVGTSAEQADQYPPIDSVVSWHSARAIPAADDATVAEWGDVSGRARHLVQATSGKQPIVRRDSPSAPRHVRFDGIDDVLATSVLSLAQPLTIVLLVRQRASGGTTQVWAGPNQAGASLLYRADNTDQVNLWGGGTDILYHRGSAWPSPWMVVTAVLNGASSSISEGKTTKVTGDPGSNGLVGLSLGGNQPGTFPAAIDVAEALVISRVVSTAERDSLVDWALARVGL